MGGKFQSVGKRAVLDAMRRPENERFKPKKGSRERDWRKYEESEEDWGTEKGRHYAVAPIGFF